MDLRPRKIKSSLPQLAAIVLAKYQGAASVTGITHDSRLVQPGDLYVALPGSNTHGISFLDQAISNGAVAVATDALGIIAAKEKEIPFLELIDARRDMAILAAAIYGHPESNLKLVGVTGTNGKTTTTHILRSMYLTAGAHVGVIGTLGTYLDEEWLPAARTTPEATELFALLAVMVERGIEYVFMEVSSHALEMHRVLGVQFDVAIFTNLTQDHLDYHGSMDNYFAAKAKLFTPTYAKHAVICVDDEWGRKLSAQLEISALSIGKAGDWRTELSILNTNLMTTQLIHLPTGKEITLEMNMLGAYNATNAACALAASEILGNPITQGLVALRNIRAIPGRLENVKIASPGRAVVDYAHTPDAVDTTLRVIRQSCAGRLITVIGCGGDRDALKRPLMGKAAAQLSDVVIITDDNPRSEDPAQIRSEVKAGATSQFAQVFEVGNRREAIALALNLATADDTVAILGKGHEAGQEIAGEIFTFDDRVVVAQESELV